jgi:hypothetical protein
MKHCSRSGGVSELYRPTNGPEHGMIPAVAGFEGAPALDNSSRYHQIIHDWFINIGV